ncbi:MAG: Stk1 family PASTA domain-containing Ser/Thr kinase [Lachnospiraceae bacterium]|nr:Stk1 family PASTA domain-containing Ser/Thr kinase [Lachnospiraceae bacterium]
MIKMGMMIGDRYEILESIGTGGMSDVYKAKCHKLNRFVAVKVLKQEFSESTEFVSKFRTEAQAAAGLMHPNIVNVYDVGEENGINYIVMELVEGITLKRYIEKKARLSVKEAVSIAIQISMGIEAAHNNNIIHRDIKPQNIIISKEGKVKVTDFGIAKAATSNTITSNVMGSVHYTSPEQARGGFSDEKSDIYSLGITMFEMLTGRVPFNGDTTVAIAIKHIQEEMPSPRNYVPEIPISVEQIVLKCTQKSPDRRYQKMPELVEDLKKSLISPNEDFVKLAAAEKSAVTKAMSDKEREQIKRNSVVKTDAVITAAAAGGIALQNTDKMDAPKTVAQKKAAQSAATDKKSAVISERQKRARKEEELATRKKTVSKPKKPQTDTYEDDDEDSPMEKLKTVLIIVGAVLIGCIILYFAGLAAGIFGNGNDKQKAEMVNVPNVIGDTLEDAKTALEMVDLKYDIEYVPSEGTAENIVISTIPTANAEVEEGTEVLLTVCMNGEGVEVPSVLNYSEAEATALLEKEGFVVEKIEEHHDEIVKGNVISQTPEAGSVMSREGTVTIIISSGKLKTDVSMPNLIGMSEEEAKQALTDLGLVCKSVSEEYSDTVESGKVCYQSYTEGSSIDEGTEIDLKLSLGPEPRYYNFNHHVAAPPRYTGGTATVILTAPDGSELWNSTTASFPVQINLSNIYAVPKGTLTITYTVYVQEEVYDAAGNVTIQNVPAQDSYTYEVTFE